MEEKPERAHSDTDTTDNNMSTVQGQEMFGAGNPRRRPEKQEWSFTLYDLDGQGRVTKEEVAHLLTSLYDAIGSSISLPENGTKSLKLLLSVSPDKATTTTTTTTTSSTDESPTTPPPPPPQPEHKDLNCAESHVDKDKTHCPKPDINTKLNNDVTSDGSCSKDDRLFDVRPLRVALPNNLSDEQKDSVQKRSPTKRLSSLEQRQLVELVQFNMQLNKNRQSRKKDDRPREKCRNASLAHVLENPDRRSYYLDLAGMENPASLPAQESPTTPPDAKAKLSGSRHRRTRHHRSAHHHHHSTPKSERPDDQQQHHSHHHHHRRHKAEALPEQQPDSKHSTPTHQRPSPASALKPKSGGSASRHRKSTAASPQKHSRSSPRKDVVETPRKDLKNEMAAAQHFTTQSTPSPKHKADAKPRRQKQKDKNHVQAMLQVAQWIEKEHSPLVEHLPQVSVEKHEHQHFHEHHHHHHYHHYHQAT